MIVLWLINIPLPEASFMMNEKPSPFGGWLVNAAKTLSESEGIDLKICFPSRKYITGKKLSGKKIEYYIFSSSNTDKSMKNNLFSDVLNEVNPDIVHIYGTEKAHSYDMVKACEDKKIPTVVSIQGLVSVYAQHMYANLPVGVLYGFTIRNLIKNDNIVGLKKKFTKKGENEIKVLKTTKHVIGRTDWDKACTFHINPEANYHFCNETLREVFYHNSWHLNKIEKFSIFVSQGQYPIKGLHYVIKALPQIIRFFPSTKLYVGGINLTSSKGLMNKLKMTFYAKYIKKLIRKLKVEAYISFTGLLDEQEMCDRLLKTHVFISPSTVENESNSLSEAKILGVPSVASYVGGVTNRINSGVDGYHYQHDAEYMLSYYVMKIFGDDSLALEFSRNAKNSAKLLHDKEINNKRQIDIYKEITNIYT